MMGMLVRLKAWCKGFKTPWGLFFDAMFFLAAIIALLVAVCSALGLVWVASVLVHAILEVGR